MNTDTHRFLYEDLMPHLLLQMVLTRPPVCGRASRDASIQSEEVTRGKPSKLFPGKYVLVICMVEHDEFIAGGGEVGVPISVIGKFYIFG